MRLPGFLAALGRKRGTRTGPAPVAQQGESTDAVRTATYTPDSPWSPGSPDLLGRRGFAKRVANTILGGARDSGLVIGIYGPWGEGKTSLLRMIEEECRERSSEGLSVDTLWFNPWYFRGQE